MNEEKQEQPHEITLPIEWYVPDTVQNRYVHNMIAQPGSHELTLFFFENQIPPFMGTPEEVRDFMLKKGSIRVECVSKMTVSPDLVPEIIKALQTGLDNYNRSRANAERKAE